MKIVDAKFARRLEAFEEHAAIYYAHALKRLQQASPAEIRPIGGGHMVFISPQAYVGRAHGLGFRGKVTAATLQKVEHFYRRHGSDTKIDVCPFAHPSLVSEMMGRGYGLGEFNQTYWRPLDGSERSPRSRGFLIRAVGPEQADIFAEVLARGFLGRKWRKADEFFRTVIQSPHTRCFMAFVDGKPAAGGVMCLVPRLKLAGVFGAATLPEFRGRGLQTALLQRRIFEAARSGATTTVVLCNAGSTSQRNIERAGFRLAYTKVVMVKK